MSDAAQRLTEDAFWKSPTTPFDGLTARNKKHSRLQCEKFDSLLAKGAGLHISAKWKKRQVVTSAKLRIRGTVAYQYICTE